MSKQYALYKIESTLGKLNGTQIYYLYFVDVDNLQEYVSIVDTSYKNYARSNWYKIINSSTPYGSYSNLKRCLNKKTSKGYPVIDADSRPKQEIKSDLAEVTQWLNHRRAYMNKLLVDALPKETTNSLENFF
jgi:hypothetical protein